MGIDHNKIVVDNQGIKAIIGTEVELVDLMILLSFLEKWETAMH